MHEHLRIYILCTYLCKISVCVCVCSMCAFGKGHIRITFKQKAVTQVDERGGSGGGVAMMLNPANTSFLHIMLHTLHPSLNTVGQVKLANKQKTLFFNILLPKMHLKRRRKK